MKYPLAKARVFQILDREGDGYSAEKIADELPELDKAGFPTTRVISDWKKEWIEKPEEARDLYRLYRWPDSHRTKALPPEAAPIGLELQRIARREGFTMPSIRQVEYAYWLTLAAPDMPVYIDPSEDANLWCIWEVSRTLAAHERSDGAGVIWSTREIDDTIITFTSKDVDGNETSWSASEEPGGRISYAEVVNDMLRWRPWESPDAGRRYLNSTYRKRGPLGVRIWANAHAPVGVLEELGWSPEDIRKAKDMEQYVFQSTGNESERLLTRVIANLDAAAAAEKEAEEATDGNDT